MGRGQREAASNPASLRGLKLSTLDLAHTLGLDAHLQNQAINHEQIKVMARNILSHPDNEAPTAAAWDNALFWLDQSFGPRDRSQYYAVGNAINFRFWSVKDRLVTRLGGEVEGKRYMWRCLRRSVDCGIPVLDANYLSKIMATQFDEIFADDEGNNPLRVGGIERIINLHDFGSKLEKRLGRIFP